MTKSKKDLISVIVPCYNEEETIKLYYEAMEEQMAKMAEVNFEIIFVNDGSKDKTLEEIRALALKDKRIKYISFSRNFGKEAGIIAGLEKALGDYVCMMDVDLQDPPSLLEEMYTTLKNEDYDCVASRSVSRNGYSFMRKTLTAAYYKIINLISKTEIMPGARDFRLMSRQMVNAILDLKEYNRYSKGIFSWVGFKTKWLTFENTERVAGTTKWNFWRLFSYSIESIVGFSIVPLILPIIFALLFGFISVLMFLIMFIKGVILHDFISDLAIIIALILFISALIFLFLSFIGKYLANTYLEVKNRPKYIIKETEEDLK